MSSRMEFLRDEVGRVAAVGCVAYPENWWIPGMVTVPGVVITRRHAASEAARRRDLPGPEAVLAGAPLPVRLGDVYATLMEVAYTVAATVPASERWLAAWAVLATAPAGAWDAVRRAARVLGGCRPVGAPIPGTSSGSRLSRG